MRVQRTVVVQVDVVAEMIITQKSSIQMQTQIQILALLSLSTVEHLRSGLLLRTLTYHPDHLVDLPHGHGRAADKMDKDALMMPSAAPASVQSTGFQ